MAFGKERKRETSNVLELQNAAKTLYTNIRFMSVDEPIKTVMLTSSVPNEGKTTACKYLGEAIASSGRDVLIVDTDMRRRSMAASLNVRSQAGLYRVLLGRTSLELAVVSTSTAHLYFLDVEPSIPNPVEVLSSKRFASFAQRLRDSYDYVIYDTPPVGTFVDAAVLSTLVDATVMVVRPDFVKREELMGAYDQLEKAGANVIGICATFVEGTGSEYYYKYYTTSSGKRVKKKKRASSSGAQLSDADVMHRSIPDL